MLKKVILGVAACGILTGVLSIVDPRIDADIKVDVAKEGARSDTAKSEGGCTEIKTDVAIKSLVVPSTDSTKAEQHDVAKEDSILVAKLDEAAGM